MSIFANGTSQLFIDGQCVDAAQGTYPVINPATGAEIGQAADANATETAAAIAAARRAFDTTDWRSNHALRARCLRQLHAVITENLEEIRQITIDEVGAPHMLTAGPQLQAPVDSLLHFAELLENFAWKQDLGVTDVMGYVSHREIRYEAAGVVAAITPWNFPHQINFSKIGPALAAGCTVVLKAAPDTPWCAALLGVMATRTDLPPGVLNILTGHDNAIGAQLVDSPDVDLVSFTGSTATGKRIMAAGAHTLKRVFLELGGKSASIVLDDGDLPAACAMTALNAALHAGQGCALTTRLLVPRDSYDEAIRLTVESFAGLAPGDPNDPGTMCGPIISQRQLDRVSGYIDLARSEGGTIEVGGEVATSPTGGGWWFTPTLISGLSPDARVAQEEIFGPVLVVLPHDGDDDAIDIANNSVYGLSGAVWSADPARQEKVINAVRTGTLSVNGAQWYGFDVPFGGYKQSGIGREMGEAGFHEYLEIKAVGTPATTEELR